jgi:uncharacterized protein (DUF433 family)
MLAVVNEKNSQIKIRNGQLGHSFRLWNSDTIESVSLSGGAMDERKLLERITVNPKIFGGKPIIRGRRLAVEHILGMLGAGDCVETILEGYPWLEREDVQACIVYARKLVGHERIEPLFLETVT